MKTQLLSLLFIFTGINLTTAQSSSSLHFDYDAAGNRILVFEYRNLSSSDLDSIAEASDGLRDMLFPGDEEAEKTEAADFRLFPNPATTHIRVDHVEGIKHNWEYRLFNTNGVIIEQGVVKQVPFDVNLQKVPRGNYYLILYSDNEQQSFSIIKM